MLEATVPIIVQDPDVTTFKGLHPTEDVVIQSEGFFLDGPIAKRVAVLDFDPTTGALVPGATFLPPNGAGRGSYRLPNPTDVSRADVVQVSVFGTVFKVLAMFEQRDTLGRPMTWAFDAPQLLVVPRAGEWANAFYERESHSLQLFFFPTASGGTFQTAQSQDIVAHETTHAILDGIAPDLYHATSPQSLALHEAVADLGALLSSLRSRELVAAVLDACNGSIGTDSALTGLAEGFAHGLGRQTSMLRDLLNPKTLDQVGTEPHALSEVLSGALYRVLVKLHDELRAAYAQGQPQAAEVIEQEEVDHLERHNPAAADRIREGLPARRAAAEALWVATERFKRTILRGLDYLPPGEISFADYARAILASDQASHPQSSNQREWLRDEFVRRKIVASAKDLHVDTDFEHKALHGADLQALVDSDWAAYAFANANRALLRIPKDIPFQVRPRLDVTKRYYHRDGQHLVRECLFKVSWTESEPNAAGSDLPADRLITVGTTLAIDWGTRRVRAVLTSDRGATQRAQRDEFLGRLRAMDLLRLGDDALGPDGRPLRSAVCGEVVDGALRVRGSARMLHLLEGN
jgi:hypothetical protein